MPRRRAVIPELSRPLSREAALARGISPDRLRSKGLEHPFHGVYQEPAAPDADEDPFLRLCRQAMARLREHQFLSHETALRVRGAPAVGRARDAVHVSAHRPAREPRTVGIVGHRLGAREPATATFRGLRLESPARAWRQAALELEVDDAVVLGDFLVARRRRLATIDELSAELDEMGATRVVDEALSLIRVGSESPEETRLRLALLRGGLPEPQLNIDLYDRFGRRIARGDIVFERWRVLVEYDGRQHAEDDAQFARDADRWDAIRDADWHLERVLRHQVRDGYGPVVERVRRALRAAGWTG